MSDFPKWEDGPKDATHWCAEGDDFYESWYKLDAGGNWFCISSAAWTEFNPAWYGLNRGNPRPNETLIMRGDE